MANFHYFFFFGRKTSITLMFVNPHLLTMLIKTMHSQEVGSFSQQAFLPKFGGTINHFLNRGEILMLFIYKYELKGINNCWGPLKNTYNRIFS